MDAERTLLFDDVDVTSAAGGAANEAADVGSLVEPIAQEGETGPALTALESTSPLVSALVDAAASLLTTEVRTVVTNQAMGARCAVAADFDSDGRMDLVSASSNDNAVSWYKNLGNDDTTGKKNTVLMARQDSLRLTSSETCSGLPTFSIKKPISWSSKGSRIVTVADIDQDGLIDVIGASYYDSSLRWFRNVPQIYNNEDDPDDPKNGSVENIKFEENLISDAVNEGQVRACSVCPWWTWKCCFWGSQVCINMPGILRSSSRRDPWHISHETLTYISHAEPRTGRHRGRPRQRRRPGYHHRIFGR